MATDLRRRTAPRRLAGVIAIALALLVVVLAVALAAGRSDDKAATPLQQGDDPGVLHVHGLGLNPADGLLYAATHTGVFRITASGDAERVAGRFQDTMGFTVIGPDRFLASGHPDLRDGGPPLLGLIESIDAAETWRRRSLHGEADLHAIVAAHDRLYAADATGRRFLVASDDGATWDERSAAELMSIAVDPGDPDHVLGVQYDATLLSSSDGGRSWRATPSPPLVAVGWSEPAELFGLAPDGGIHASSDGGTSWNTVGTLSGAGTALLVTDDALYAASEGGGIFVSYNAGRSWRSLIKPS